MNAVLIPARMPGYGDPITWGGLRPAEPAATPDPADEIRAAFAGDLREPVAYIDHAKQCEESCPASDALIEAVSNCPAVAADVVRLVMGDATAAERIRSAAADYWINEQARDLQQYRDCELFDWQQEDF